ncbi:type II secretion system protein [Saccharopolyspora subtropica]|uniref:Type II secretion system protein n=1 Tax=Saccharopolyspora thermophila TaxID=89367 RepID=A0A917N7H9_9PSEU|nr:type II secretion system F family protein [Saccharopolyspora subtropica]GGI67311.1 type II secretion system protein [Saccharopolyspora subtropica]
MLIHALLAAAAGVLCWPRIQARHRLLPPEPARLWARPLGRGPRLLLVPAGALIGLLVAGPAGSCAVVALTVLTVKYWRTQREWRRQLARADELTAGLRLLVAQLRAGAHPAAAAEGAAAEAGPAVGGVFRDMAATARLGGDVAAALSGQGIGELREPLGRVARAWALAERHGVALADLLDAVRRDVERRTAFRRNVEAKMAGPRSTAAVLTGLPVLGVLFGQAVGADPMAVFAGGPLGQLLLLAGVALLCAGTCWTVRLTRAVAQP